MCGGFPIDKNGLPVGKLAIKSVNDIIPTKDLFDEYWDGLSDQQKEKLIAAAVIAESEEEELKETSSSETLPNSEQEFISDEIEQEIVLSLAKRNSAFLEDDNA